MYSVSPKWAPALAHDHGLSVKVNAIYDGAVVAEGIDFAGGSVRVDRGSDVRRSLTLTIADPTAWPFEPTDILAPYGQQLYVESGVTYLDGSAERVPLGTFVITRVSGDIHTGPLTVQASGLELLLKRALWDSAVSTTGYASAAAFVGFHIADSVPGADFIDDSSGGSEPLATKSWDARGVKWAALQEVAQSIGAELFCDAAGTFRLADIPNPLATSPVWTVGAGEGGVMVSANLELTSDEVFNRVTVSGENAADNAPPVWAEALITDPADPLRYDGPFGRVTKAYSSNLITTTPQAQGVANSLVVKYRAPNRRVSLEAVPNPALDAGDCIRVDYGPAAPPELHITHSFSVPLGVTDGAFSIETVSGKDESDG